MTSRSERELATEKDLLNLVSAILNDPDCREIMIEIAKSEGSQYIKWRAPTPDEALALSRFRKKWFIENMFSWPPSVDVGRKLGYYFPIVVRILRGEYSGVDDGKLLKYLSSVVFIKGET